MERRKTVLGTGLLAAALAVGCRESARENTLPTADDQSLTTLEDTPASVTLTASDADGDALDYSIATGPQHGTLTGTPPDLTYAPDADYNGPDSFTFVVNDGEADSTEATISVAVEAVNDAGPVADDQPAETDEGTAVSITLTASDVDGDPLVFVIATDPANGTLSGLDPATGAVTYAPDPDYVGPDTFTFLANDGTVDSAEATVSIIVGRVALLDPVGWDLPYQRWQDIADHDYDVNQVNSYLYPDGAVTVYYDGVAPTLTGTLTGSGLKPNFAYQIKLNGKPTHTFPADGDDWANEQLGYAGRWWLSKVDPSSGEPEASWNSDDAEYEYWKSELFTDGTYDYVFEGYLFFDYIVTDDAGGATKSLALDSSLHVLWKPTQRTAEAEDTAPTSHTVIAGSASDWYDQSYPQSTVEIYAEWEPGPPGRDLPGTLVLPDGTYNVRMFLTEESFHDGVSGWATVMACDDLLFTVAAP